MLSAKETALYDSELCLKQLVDRFYCLPSSGAGEYVQPQTLFLCIKVSA